MRDVSLPRTHRNAVLFLAVLGLCLLTPAQAQQGEETAATPPAPAPATNPLKARDELQAAYQKEYAFLETQARELKQRLSEFETTARNAENEKTKLIDRIEGEYIELQSAAEQTNSLLADAERQIASIEDNSSTLEATFLQAGSTLEPYHIAYLGSEEYLSLGDDQKIEALFDHALELLSSLGKLRKGPGRFFLQDGTEVEGTLIHVGSIASFGLAGERGGALAPAGEGQLKVWTGSTTDTARALAEGRSPDMVDVFVYESTQKAIEEKQGKSVAGYIQSGGSIAWIIVGLGVLGVVLIILRIFFLRAASASTGKVSSEVGGLVREGRLEDALKACKRLKGSTANVVASAVRNLDRDREHIEDIVSEQILHESAHLNRFGAFIMVIAAVAPLLGLLGTVTGMISTFDIITEFGTGDPKLLSSGISIALITTEVGLEVAIPTLIFGNLLSGWAESIKDDMEKAALHVMNLYKDTTGKSRSVA